MLAKMQILPLRPFFVASWSGATSGILSHIGSVCFFPSTGMHARSGHHFDSQAARLRHNALHDALER